MEYQALYQSGELLQLVRKAYLRLAACDLCPHNCGVNRLKGQTGVCRSGLKPKIASSNVHTGEEPPISGTRGSGTLFFSGCSLKCRFCQNFPFSQLGNGEEISTMQLASRMLRLQRQKVHNINLVTATHFLPQVLAALWLAIPKGFRLPLVWNSSGYEKVDVLGMLEGIVSIYLPDMKYVDDSTSLRLSSAPGYKKFNRDSVLEMFRQVGHLQLDENGLAVKGLIIRHLVLPEELADTWKTLRWIRDNLGAQTHISLMKQYFPVHKALKTAGIDRKINDEEYEEAALWLEKYGLQNGWVQN
jgi:putative pyruvate formate lyase activating enzyme